MPNAFVINRRFAGGAYGASLSALFEMLISAGWTYCSSGDGLAGYSSSGKIFTGTGSGALGWNNNRGWARVRDPAGRRELCIQHNAANGVRIKISTDARFIGGSPSATVVPSATDERVLWGSGTDASPTLSTWFDVVAAQTDCVVYQGAAFSAAPYGFWFGSQLLHASRPASHLMMDPVLGVAADPDPVVWQVGTSGACTLTTSSIGRDADAAATWAVTAGGTNQGCFAHLNAAQSSFVYVQPLSYSGGSVGLNPAGFQPGGGGNVLIGHNSFNAGLDALPVLYARFRQPSTVFPSGIKGWSSLCMWSGVDRQSFFDTLNAKQWICYGSLWLRWDGNSQPFG